MLEISVRRQRRWFPDSANVDSKGRLNSSIEEEMDQALCNVTLLTTCGSGVSNRLVNVLGEDHKLSKASWAHPEGSGQNDQKCFYSFIKLPEGKMSTLLATVHGRPLEEFGTSLCRRSFLSNTMMKRLRRLLKRSVLQPFDSTSSRSVRRKGSRSDGGGTAFEADSAPYHVCSHTSLLNFEARDALPTSPTQRPSVDAMPEGLVELLRLMCKHDDVLERSVREKAHLFAYTCLSC